MKRVVLSLYIFSVIVASAVANDTLNNVESDPVFGKKVVLCKVDFMPNSFILSEQARTVLDNVLFKLKTIDTTTNTIRIEGFPGVLDSSDEPSRLSLNRAIVVEDYYRLHHKATFERFLTGHKVQGSDPLVKIIVYENPWGKDVSEMQVASKDGGDGPS